jgi:CubicO group peptidase (beta-lactamase class C family)
LLFLVDGEVTARVSGMPWKQFVETRIMKPLQMDTSAASLEGIDYQKTIATPHSTEGNTNQIRTIPLYKKIINGQQTAFYQTLMTRVNG